MTDRPHEVDAILGHSLRQPEHYDPATDLVPVPDYLLEQRQALAPKSAPGTIDFNQAAGLLGLLLGQQAQQYPQQLPPAQGAPQKDTPYIAGQLGTAPHGAPTSAKTELPLREKLTNLYRTNKVVRVAGASALTLVLATGLSKGFTFFTGESPIQYALTGISSGKQAIGLGNTYDLVMNSGDCTTPIATVDIMSGATMTVSANKATNPDDIVKNRKDPKHPVPTELVNITPLVIASNPFTGSKTPEERDPEIHFDDTLAALVCSEGGVHISGLNAEVDPSKVGVRLVSTAVLSQTFNGLEANPKRVNLYEPVAIAQEKKGQKPMFSDPERKAINSLMGSGTNVAITNAFRQNVTLKDTQNKCGADIQALQKESIAKYLQLQFDQQVEKMTDAVKKQTLEGKKLNVTWKDGESFKTLQQEFVSSQEDKSYAVPERITFQNPATTCSVTPFEEKK